MGLRFGFGQCFHDTIVIIKNGVKVK